MTKEFWIPNIGAFVRLRNIEEIKKEDLDFEVIKNSNHLRVDPDEADELYRGILDAKKTGVKQGINKPEGIGEWINTTPIEVIATVGDMGRSGKFVSLYPIPKDIQFEI